MQFRVRTMVNNYVFSRSIENLTIFNGPTNLINQNPRTVSKSALSQFDHQFIFCAFSSALAAFILCSYLEAVAYTAEVSETNIDIVPTATQWAGPPIVATPEMNEAQDATSSEYAIRSIP